MFSLCFLLFPTRRSANLSTCVEWRASYGTLQVLTCWLFPPPLSPQLFARCWKSRLVICFLFLWIFDRVQASTLFLVTILTFATCWICRWVRRISVQASLTQWLREKQVLALPNGFLPNGMPAGISLIGRVSGACVYVIVLKKNSGIRWRGKVLLFCCSEGLLFLSFMLQLLYNIGRRFERARNLPLGATGIHDDHSSAQPLPQVRFGSNCVQVQAISSSS